MGPKRICGSQNPFVFFLSNRKSPINQEEFFSQYDNSNQLDSHELNLYFSVLYFFFVHARFIMHKVRFSLLYQLQCHFGFFLKKIISNICHFRYYPIFKLLFLMNIIVYCCNLDLSIIIFLCILRVLKTYKNVLF